jgi:hypothetical protein
MRSRQSRVGRHSVSIFRMSAWRRVASIVVLCCAASASAGQFENADPVHLDQTIDSLSSTNWRQRHEAVEHLIRVGPAAQRRLEKLVESPVGPETRLRAQEALRQIVPQRRVEPALITREFVDANVADVFDRVAEIEGASLRCEPPNLIGNIKHHITVRYEREAYWNVMLDLCRRSGLRLRCDERGVTIIKAGPRAKDDRFCVSGVLLITAPQEMLTRTVLRSSIARLAVFAEPRARLLRGQSLHIENISVGFAEPLTNGFWWQMKRSQSASLRGFVSVLLVESQPTIEAPGTISRTGLGGPLPLSFSTGGLSASVLRVVKTQLDYQIDIQLAVDPAELDWESLIFSMRTGGMRVYDVDDRELSFVQLACDGLGPADNARLIVSPRSDAASVETDRPYKLVWDVPAKTKPITLPFQLSERPAE